MAYADRTFLLKSAHNMRRSTSCRSARRRTSARGPRSGCELPTAPQLKLFPLLVAQAPHSTCIHMVVSIRVWLRQRVLLQLHRQRPADRQPDNHVRAPPALSPARTLCAFASLASAFQETCRMWSHHASGSVQAVGHRRHAQVTLR